MKEKREIITEMLPLLLNQNTMPQAYELIKENMENMIANSNSKEELRDASILLRRCCEFATKYDMKDLINDCKKWIIKGRTRLNQLNIDVIQQENIIENTNFKKNIIFELDEVKIMINQMKNSDNMDIEKIKICKNRLVQLELALESNRSRLVFNQNELNNYIFFVKDNLIKINKYLEIIDESSINMQNK